MFLFRVKDVKWYWAALVAAGCGILVGVVLVLYEKIRLSR